MQQINNLSEEINFFEKTEKEVNDLKELAEFLENEKEIEQKIIELEKSVKEKELETFLSEKYDKNNAILQVFSGAGGIDSQDWANILLRMFQRSIFW